MVRGLFAAIATTAMLVGGGSGVAMADPSPELVEAVGKPAAQIMDDEIESLCMGKEDDGTEAASDCDIDDPKLMAAADECVDEADESLAEDEFADKKDEFLKCLGEAGYGADSDEEEEETPEDAEAMADLSLARMSSALSAFYANSLSPAAGSSDSKDSADEGEAATETEPTKGLEAWAPVLTVAGNAGSFMGAPDQTKKESSNWIFGVNDSANAATYSYSAFDRLVYDDQGGVITEKSTGYDLGTSAYTTYGALLNGLGLDSAAAADGGSSVSRQGLGTIMIAAYAGSYAVDAVFDSVVSVLQWANPFGWMVDAVTDHTSPTFTEGMQGANDGEPEGTFDGLKDFFGLIYNGVVSIGWMVTIPLFIGGFMVGVLLMRKFEVGKNLKHLVIRVAFLVIGVPLLGVTYTASLAAIDGASGDASKANASKIVLSTYVDFDRWVDGARLAPPDKTDMWWDLNENAPNGASIAKTRQTALAINGMIRPDVWGPVTGTESGANDSAWAGSVTDTEVEAGSVDDDGTLFGSVMDLLNRYRAGDTVSAGDYESGVKAGLMKLYENDPAVREEVLSWITDFSSADKLSQMTSEDVAKMQNPLIQVLDGASLQRGVDSRGLVGYSKDPAKDKGTTDGAATLSGSASTEGCTAELVATSGWGGDTDADPRSACAMSPLAMFNYLNTDFEATSARTYSPASTTSEYARVSHASVNAVGTGAAQLLYWFSAMTILVSFVIIGLIYALSMMIGTIRRGLGLLGNVPFATMGFIAAIAKVVVYTFAMFLEIFATLFLYKMVQELLMIVPSLLEKPLAERMSGGMDTDEMIGFGSAVAGAGIIGMNNIGTVVLIVTLVSSIGVILFTVMAVKLRSALMEGIDSAMTRVVNKFIGTEVSGSRGDDKGPGVFRQAVTRGGTMAGMSAIMGGGGDDGGGGGDSGGEGGAGGVAEGTGEGVPGGGDGSMTVGAGGELADNAGNPVNDADGNALNVASMIGDGNLADGSGGEIVGADGNPMSSSDVGGFGSDGGLLDTEGNQIVDGEGNPLTSAKAADVSSGLAGDKALASSVQRNGLTDFGDGSGTAVPVGAPGNFGGTHGGAESSQAASQHAAEASSSSGGSGGGGGSAMRTMAGVAGSTAVNKAMLKKQQAPEWSKGTNGGGGGGQGGGGTQGPMGGQMPKKQPGGGAASSAMRMGTRMGTMRAMQQGQADGGEDGGDLKK